MVKFRRDISEPRVSLAKSPLEVAVQNSFVSMDWMSDAECLDLRFGSVDMNDFNLGDVKVIDTCTNSGLRSGPVVSHASLPMIVAVHNSVGSASMCDFDIGDVEPSALNVVWEALMYRSISALHNSVQCWSSDHVINNTTLNSSLLSIASGAGTYQIRVRRLFAYWRGGEARAGKGRKSKYRGKMERDRAEGWERKRVWHFSSWCKRSGSIGPLF